MCVFFFSFVLQYSVVARAQLASASALSCMVSDSSRCLGLIGAWACRL